MREAVEKILRHVPEEVPGYTSSMCPVLASPKPFLARFKYELRPEAEMLADSPEFKKFVDIMGNCEKTITVDMARTGGQFGSQFNTEILAFSFLGMCPSIAVPNIYSGFVTGHSVIFDMERSILGRWCSFFKSLNTCKAHDNTTAFSVAVQKGKTFSTHFLLPNFKQNHLYFQESGDSIFGPIGRNILYYYLNQASREHDGKLQLFRKFAMYAWQLPDHLLEQLKSLISALRLEGPFVGAHVRWGDKKSESKLIPAAIYAYHLRKVANKIRTKDIYIMSDSSKAIEELQILLPEFNIRTTTPPSWLGNDLDSFKDKPVHEREGSLALLILELTIMSQADSVVCMMSSNVCRLLQTLRIQPAETLIGIEFRREDAWTCRHLSWNSFLENYFCVDSQAGWGPF